MKRRLYINIYGLFLAVILLSLLPPIIITPAKAQEEEIHGVWTPLDTSNKEVEVIGEKIGSQQRQPFAGWYTDTVAVDPETGTIVIAWVRLDVDKDGNDAIYLLFLIPVDADNDEKPEAYQKIIRFVDKVKLVSLDSLTISTKDTNGDGKREVLLTWTYYAGRDNNVKGALYSTDGKYLWKGNIRSTNAHEEWSRSCYVPKYNDDKGGFLIIWYTSSDKSIDGKWLYYDEKEKKWELTGKFDIADTNKLYYEKADQMLCIGGQSKALVVFRKWDSNEGKRGRPDLYAALVDVDNNVKEKKLWDFDGAEETVGVRGAYANGYFIVPLLSGRYVKYDIVIESNGTVYNMDYVTSNGAYPYAIALSHRFVLAWIDYYEDSDGEPKIANIDLKKFDTHPQYGVKVTSDRDSNYDRHPLIAYAGNGKLLYIWSSSSDGKTYDIKYAIVSLGNKPTDDPTIGEVGTLISWDGDQRAHGLGVVSLDQYVVAFTDTIDGEEDLLAYVTLPGVMKGWELEKYMLPDEHDDALKAILGTIERSKEKLYIAMAYWHNDKVGEKIANAVIEAHERNVDVSVVLDNDTRNEEIKKILEEHKITVVDDSSATEEYHIMHDKFIVADDTVILLTANFIEEDFGKNDNVIIVLRHATSIAHFYEEEAKQMLGGSFGASKEDDFSFIVFADRDVVFEGYFSPTKNGMRDKISQAIYGYISRASSKSTIRFTSYIFTTSGYVQPIYNAIVDKLDEDVDVIGIFDEGMNLDQPGRMIYWFVDKDVKVYINNHPGKVHVKVFAIEDEEQNYFVSIVGSWNPTYSATVNHDENILVIRETKADLVKSLIDFIKEIKAIPATDRYNPLHLVISRVMFQGDPKDEWVEIRNPTRDVIDLSNYVIGDAEDLLHGDNEGLYRFPSGAKIEGGGRIIVAYNSTAFYEVYGFYPDYEIVDANKSIPDLQPYDTDKFTGSWNLDDSGDEVILAVDEGGGFLRVVDAVWYGNSKYMETKDMGQPESGKPLDISGIQSGFGIEDKGYDDGKWDALRMTDKYRLVNLSNTPAYAVLSLGSVDKLKVQAIDPDGKKAWVERVIINGHSIDGGVVDLAGLELSEGIYDVLGELGEETPIGEGHRGFNVSKALGVIRSPNGEILYCVSENGGIESIVYEPIKVDLHRIVVKLNHVEGWVNVTIPGFWNTSTLKVEVDGNEYNKFSNKNGVVVIDLDNPASEIVLSANTPKNHPVEVEVKPTEKGDKIVIKAVDPDNKQINATVKLDGKTIKSLSGEGSVETTIEAQEGPHTLYIKVVEETPSYVKVSNESTYTLYVEKISEKEYIVTISKAQIESVSYKIINTTTQKIEIIVEGQKDWVYVNMPSNWKRVKAVYINGVDVTDNKKVWRVEDNIIYVDPSISNITIVGETPLGGTPVILLNNLIYIEIATILLTILIILLTSEVLTRRETTKAGIMTENFN